MANGTASVIEPTESIQKEMHETRESITQKVAALENQVVNTLQAVTGTVDAVKEAVTTTPTAVSETVRQTVDEVKQTLHEKLASLQLASCVRNHPWPALGISLLGGFLLSQRFFTPRSSSGKIRAVRTPACGEDETLLARLVEMVGDGVCQLAENSLKTAMDSLNRSVGAQVPDLVDSAVRRFGSHLHNGTCASSRP